MFIVPTVPTFSVWMGFASYCGGDAGEAKCRTYLTSPPRKTPWLTSTCRSSKSGLPWRWRTFCAEPVMKLSSANTFMPRSSSASHRCEPMNPAPPETTALGFGAALLAANTAIREAEGLHRAGVVDVPPVDEHGAAHELLDARHVELAELVPLRDQHERVRAARDRVGVLDVFHVRQQPSRH